MPGEEKDPKELMKQRDDVLSKLKKLEDRKDSTKEKIYQKVRHDYETKLEELNDALKQQEGVVKERITSLKHEESTLKDERETYADKAEELKLRFELGEFEEDEYRKILAEEEARIRAIDDKLDSVKGEIASMKGFVSTEEEPVAEIEEEVTETEPVEEISEPAREEIPEEPSAVEQEETVSEDTGAAFVQEKEFEAAFSDNDPDSDEAQKAEIAESLEESIDDLLKETPAEAAQEEDTETEQEVDETPEEDMETVGTDDEEPKIEQAFDTGILSEGDAIKEETSKLEGFPEDAGELKEEAAVEEGDDSEGLQCPKCNFLNSKDSWYCEKCGAELLQ